MAGPRLQKLKSLFTLGKTRRAVALGFKTLWLHRMRSFLTMLGIVFGVCSVVAMLAVGEGAGFEAQEQIRRLGSQNIILRSIKPTDTERISTEQSRISEYGLRYDDVKRIQDTIPSVKVLAPGRIIRNHVWNATRRVDAEIIGVVPWYPEVRKLRVTEGRFFTPVEYEGYVNLCVIGMTVADHLFPFSSPLGRNVRIGTDYYKVVGVVEPEASSGGTNGSSGEGQAAGNSMANDYAPRVYIPLTAARNRFGETLIRQRQGSFEAERVELHEAIVQVDRLEDVEETALVIDSILSSQRRSKDYEMVVPLELLRQAERTKQIFNTVLGAIAAISLLVGGIGIMNIMLASVTERTREIGIRRALGAKKRDIIVQFLIETVILSGTGGLIGVIIGVVIPIAISHFAEMKTIVTPWAPMLAFSISGFVGIVFGIYPALRAANMDPVEALRHE
ncbi:MAG: FtsX-like permease family protein [Candidatus Hydrogenedentes bacterium]|nr:FtsX-like permease family protein [Candidatus Hydrogenedentota bacterium]